MKRYLPVAVTLILLTVFLLHAGLIGAGQWQADEYFIFFHYRHDGYKAITERLLWSPRPFSEILLYLYFQAVEYFHAPLIAPFLGFCWAMLVASVFYNSKRYWRDKNIYGVIIACTLLCMFVLGPKNDDLFYWPQSAAAYIITLAAIVAIFFQVIEKDELKNSRVLYSILMIIAATSSEVGAMFVLAFSVLQCCFYHSPVRRTMSDWGAIVLPLLVSAGIFVLLVAGRLTYEEGFGALHHSLGFSAGQGTTQFLIDLLAPVTEIDLSAYLHDDTHSMLMNGLSIFEGILIKVLFFIGFTLCWKKASPEITANEKRTILLFIAALLLTCMETIMASYYQFGLLCCARHESLRQSFIIVALAAFSVYCSARFFTAASWSKNSYAALILLLPVLLLLERRVPGLWNDYSYYPQSVRIRTQSWESGLSPKSSKMVFYMAPPAMITNGTPNMIPGSYDLLHHGGGIMPIVSQTNDPVLQFFDKETIEVIEYPE